MRAVTVTLLLDVDSDDEAHDAMNEILREQQRSFTPSSCLIDYALAGDVVDAGPLPADYAEGDYFDAGIPKISDYPMPAENTSASVTPAPGGSFANMKPLSQVAAERAPLDQPQEIAKRLSPKQRELLLKLAARPKGWFPASELGTSGSVLASLNDFERGQRDCLAPLILITWDRCEPSGKRAWSITEFGKQVLKYLPATLQTAA